jgi:putative ABC transport system permease protein
LSLCFALVALALTAVGLTGVMAFTVSQRTHELGIRLALGARRSAVLLMVMQQGMALVVAGLAIGVLGALPVAHALAGLLFGVRPVDAATYCGVLLAVTAITLAACFVPARRATTIDPLKALRAT